LTFSRTPNVIVEGDLGESLPVSGSIYAAATRALGIGLGDDATSKPSR
jgi:hypothetical protein